MVVDRMDRIPTAEQARWEELARRAKGHLRRAVGLDPRYVEAHLLLADLSLARYYRTASEPGAKRHLQAAEAAYRRVVSLDLGHEQARFGLAEVYAILGEFDRELAQYQAILKRDPRDADALWARGWVYLERGEYAKAVADFEAVLRQDPEDWEAL